MSLTIPAESKKGFLLVVGIIAALYVGKLVLDRLP